jgi:transcription initiation factor TFIID subunit 5
MNETIPQNGFVDEHLDGADTSIGTFNSKEPIRLGPVQIGPNLAKHAEIKLDEVKQEKGEESEATARAPGDGDVEMGDVSSTDKASSPKADAPEVATAPIPRAEVIGFGSANNFGSVDLAKEVKSITDARKRIKLGDKAMVAMSNTFVRQPSLPSVCCYTIFDGGEGTTATAISDDASYMAAGSSESVVRLWSLKGENLKTREYGYATKIAQGGGKSYGCLKQLRGN